MLTADLVGDALVLGHVWPVGIDDTTNNHKPYKKVKLLCNIVTTNLKLDNNQKMGPQTK